MEKTNLYAYFGSFGTHSTLDIPGHSFYQIGLLSAISKSYDGLFKFTLFSYLEDIEQFSCTFPKDEYGELMTSHALGLISSVERSLENVLKNIKSRSYHKIFLKARFRNLSTLTKKYKDTLVFERILKEILDTDFPRDRVFIVDTDLSLPIPFKQFLVSNEIKWIIPSIDFPGISADFASSFIDLNLKGKFSAESSNTGVMFYGNIDASNYKQGHAKSDILIPILKQTQDIKTMSGHSPHLTIVAKVTPEIAEDITDTLFIRRNDRESAWSEFIKANICLNITKNLYDEVRFIPARLYESIIFGCIPVSYKFDWLDSAMSFNNVEEYSEIIKFIMEISPSEQGKLYSKLANKIVSQTGVLIDK